jgi:hypothetical protein
VAGGWRRLHNEELHKLNVSPKDSPSFTEPEGSLPRSQEPGTGHCREPDKSILHLHTLFA